MPARKQPQGGSHGHVRGCERDGGDSSHSQGARPARCASPLGAPSAAPFPAGSQPSPRAGPDRGAAAFGRRARAEAAAETLAALRAGGYRRSSGRWVDLQRDLEACRGGTVYYPPGSDHHMHLPPAQPTTPGSAVVELVACTTLEAAAALTAQGWRVAALNFASARHPGGGFANGAQAQEECLTRQTALYHAIAGNAFYKAAGRHSGCTYTHALIYSPDVPVLRSEGAEGAAVAAAAAAAEAAAPGAATVAAAAVDYATATSAASEMGAAAVGAGAGTYSEAAVGVASHADGGAGAAVPAAASPCSRPDKAAALSAVRGGGGDCGIESAARCWSEHSPDLPLPLLAPMGNTASAAEPLLDRPWHVSVLTCAAPNAGVALSRRETTHAELESLLLTRADRVLGAAAVHGHAALVLGAWGCGVFKNDPSSVAAAFSRLLRGKYAGRFARVVFAIPGTPDGLAGWAAVLGVPRATAGVSVRRAGS